MLEKQIMREKKQFWQFEALLERIVEIPFNFMININDFTFTAWSKDNVVITYDP